MSAVATVTMLFGHLGAGKTTLARRLEAAGAVRLSIDEWLIAVSGDRRHLDDDVKERVMAQLLRSWPGLARAGVDVVLDLGFWRRADRDDVRRVATELGVDARLVWVRCDADERLRRCLTRSEHDPDCFDIDADAFAWISANRLIEEPGPDEEHTCVDTTTRGGTGDPADATSDAPSTTVRAAASAVEVDAAFAVLDAVLAAGRSWAETRVDLLRGYRAEPALLSIAIEGDQVVGAVGSNGVDGISVVAVADVARGRGVGRRLLAHAEATLRDRGAAHVGLGSLDGAVDFYLRSGYLPRLLVQFAPEAVEVEEIIDSLLTGVLASRNVHRASWHGHPQLWVHERVVDWDLKDAVEATAHGVVAQYVMDKSLVEPP